MVRHFWAFIRYIISCYAHAFTCFSVQENPHSEPLLQPLFAPRITSEKRRIFGGVSTLKWTQNGSVLEENGTFLGEVTDVIQNTAQDIFEVQKQGGKKVLIPKVDEFVLNIDIEKKEILVRLIDGLMDL